ncbi:MAG TPA: cytochrome P450 [Conexibacter sp.]|jgi:cytochrome P450
MNCALATEGLDLDLEALLSSQPQALADPFSVWNRIRSQSAVHPHGPVVLVTRYDDVKAILRDADRFSSRGRSAGSRANLIRSAFPPEAVAAWEEVTAFENLYVSRSDGDQHERLRHVAHRTFTPRRIAQLDEITRAYTEQLLDECASAAADAGAPCDLMAMFAYRLPLMVICDLLGVGADEREQIHGWSNTLGRNRGGDDPAVTLAARDALNEFRAFVQRLIVPLRERRGTDLLSALMDAEGDARLSEEELVAMFVILLFAGHETTTNLIANGTLLLMKRRDQWERLVADPSLIPNAVEELLRMTTPSQWQFRLATEDVTVGGTTIEEGQTVYAVTAAANRDPDVFADPDELDVARANARAHLSLGFGPHFCLGNSLARLEGIAALEAMTRRFPEMQLATDTLAWRGNAMLRGLVELPVRLTPR